MTAILIQLILKPLFITILCYGLKCVTIRSFCIISAVVWAVWYALSRSRRSAKLRGFADRVAPAPVQPPHQRTSNRQQRHREGHIIGSLPLRKIKKQPNIRSSLQKTVGLPYLSYKTKVTPITWVFLIFLF